MSGCNCSGSSAAKSWTVGYFSNSPGVTMFTRTSVDCADRIVATSNSHALRWVRAQVTPGYIWSSPAIIWRTRSGARGSYLEVRVVGTFLPPRDFVFTLTAFLEV